MPTTVLYRKSSNEVVKISAKGQTFSDRNTTYWGVLTDPTFTDGTECVDADFNLRVLGYSKIQVGGTTVRNATQLEIDTFAGFETADENLQDKTGAQDLFKIHPRFRKVFKAMLEEFVSEFDKTTNPKAQMSIITGNTSQLMTSKTWEKIELFNNVDGRDSESFDSLSVDLTNSKIVSTLRGRHYCSFNVCFTGDVSSDFLFEIAVNGSGNDNIRARSKVNSAGDMTSCGSSGFLTFPLEGTNEVTLLCRNMEDTNRNLTIAECNITVFRLENNVGRSSTELVTAIDGQFSEND